MKLLHAVIVLSVGADIAIGYATEDSHPVWNDNYQKIIVQHSISILDRSNDNHITNDNLFILSFILDYISKDNIDQTQVSDIYRRLDSYDEAGRLSASLCLAKIGPGASGALPFLDRAIANAEYPGPGTESAGSLPTIEAAIISIDGASRALTRLVDLSEAVTDSKLQAGIIAEIPVAIEIYRTEIRSGEILFSVESLRKLTGLLTRSNASRAAWTAATIARMGHAASPVKPELEAALSWAQSKQDSNLVRGISDAIIAAETK